MKISRASGLLIALLLVYQFLPAYGQGCSCDLPTDVDAELTVWGFCLGGFFLWRGDNFRNISNGDQHRLVSKWEYYWLGRGGFVRSYIHFDENELPSCIGKAYLSLYFSEPDSPTTVELYYVNWDGSSFGWFSRPGPEDLIESFTVSNAGCVEIDVTDKVKEVQSSPGEELAFMLRVANDLCPGYSTSILASFIKPCLRFVPCIEVEVKGLEDFEVTQTFLSANRYAPLGELTVTVDAEVNYEVRACYEVDPMPSPPYQFTGDPIDIAYTWFWINVPACPSYIVLPGFSGTPGNETRTYQVRVDLADLGDRASDEEFKFTIRVWAVPR